MRRNSDVVGLSHGGDLLAFRDAARVGQIRLDNVDGALFQQGLVVPAREQAFAGGKRGGGMIGNFAEGLHVFA